MKKIVPLLGLTFSIAFASSPLCPAQITAKKGDKKLVTPGATAPKIGKKPADSSTPISTAFVRVLHAVPGGPKVDVFAGSLEIASNRGYTGLSDYLPIKVGKSTFKVFNAGTTSPLVTTDSFNFKGAKYYTIAIYGKRSPVLLSIDESRGKANIEKTRVRAVHLAPGAPDLLITSPSTHNDAGYMKLVAKPLKYGKMGSKLSVPKVTTIQIRTLEGKLLKETPALSFDAAKRYTAFIIGDIYDTKDNKLDVMVKLAGEPEKAAP